MPNLPLCDWSSQLFDLRTPSSTDVPVLPQPSIVGSGGATATLRGRYFGRAINGSKATTSSDHFLNNRFVSQSNTVLKNLSRNRPLLKFFKRPRPLFKPETLHIQRFSLFPVLVSYDLA